MGRYYKFANHTNKEILDFHSAKIGEIRVNSFDNKLLTHYLSMSFQPNEYEFVSDEGGGWDKCREYKDITCDVLYHMFESDYIPNPHMLKWIFEKFQRADKLDELGEWSELPLPNQRLGKWLPHSQLVARRSYTNSRGIIRSSYGNNTNDNQVYKYFGQFISYLINSGRRLLDHKVKKFKLKRKKNE